MDLQLAICGSNSDVLRLPAIEQIRFQDFQSLDNHVDRCARTRSFIILTVNIDSKCSKQDVDRLRRKRNIFAICICVKSKTNFSFIANNVYPVTKQFLGYQLSQCIIDFYQIESRQYLLKNNFPLANEWQTKANRMKDQRRSLYSTFDACHAALIPMNVFEDITYNCFGSAIDCCNNLSCDYGPLVRLLEHFFPLDQNSTTYNNEYVRMLCAFIKIMAPIRLYLFGNEQKIEHPLAEALYKSEIFDPNASEYDGNCTCLEYEPITDVTKSTFLKSYMENNIRLKRLDQIQNDSKFISALNRAHLTIEGRTLNAINQLTRQSNDSIRLGSFSFDCIEQTAAVNSTLVNNTDINISIQNFQLNP